MRVRHRRQLGRPLPYTVPPVTADGWRPGRSCQSPPDDMPSTSSTARMPTMWQQRRSVVVWLMAAAVLISVFMGFVILGWPGQADTCVGSVPDSCYCEAFDRDTVQTEAGGVR